MLPEQFLLRNPKAQVVLLLLCTILLAVRIGLNISQTLDLRLAIPPLSFGWVLPVMTRFIRQCVRVLGARREAVQERLPLHVGLPVPFILLLVHLELCFLKVIQGTSTRVLRLSPARLLLRDIFLPALLVVFLLDMQIELILHR